MKKGRFIVFEGVSGTGKETQAKLLREYLGKQGIKSQIVFHPSPELKVILSEWRKLRNIDQVSEVYFLLADRYNRVQRIIKPALAQGEWVISLRNYTSTLVYQGKAIKDRQWITQEFLRFEPKPGVLFYFDLAPALALARVIVRHAKTGEPTGKFETLKLLREKRDAYHDVLKLMPHVRVDASKSIDEIQRFIQQHLPL